jgi:hypothetical protein
MRGGPVQAVWRLDGDAAPGDVRRVPPGPPFPEALWDRKVCAIVWCYTGPHDRAEAILDPVKRFGSPLMVGLQPMPFSVIDVHRKFGALLPTGLSTMHLYPIDGAASRVASDATAFAYRDGGWAGIIVGVDPDPANADLITEWAQRYWEELHPTSAGGAYVNFLMDEGQDRVKAAYRGNYDRLA